MLKIDANGETLSYRREGSGPSLVLVHSLGTNAGLWDSQFAAWTKRFDVIAFDARGHGGSTNRGGISMRHIADDIGAALKLMGIGRAHFVGISMGGLICSRLYERDPMLFETIAISGSFVSIDGGAERVKMLESRIGAAGLEQYGREYAAETLLPDTPREHHEALARWIASMTLEDYLQTVRSIFTENVETCMRAMKIPARVLVGDKDQRTPLALAERMAKVIPGASLHMIADAAHLANLDQPSRFNAAVEGLIGG
jgi:3-oxoadipate enol-lactonase